VVFDKSEFESKLSLPYTHYILVSSWRTGMCKTCAHVFVVVNFFMGPSFIRSIQHFFMYKLTFVRRCLAQSFAHARFRKVMIEVCSFVQELRSRTLFDNFLICA